MEKILDMTKPRYSEHILPGYISYIEVLCSCSCAEKIYQLFAHSINLNHSGKVDK